MKRWRVIVTTCVVAALVIFICFVPVPIGRIRSHGIVETQPEANTKVFVNYSGKLDKLLVGPGQYVRKGEELAVFTNKQLQNQIDEASTEMTRLEQQTNNLRSSLARALNDKEKSGTLNNELGRSVAELNEKKALVEELTRIKNDKLVLHAPEAGVIGLAPDANDIGRWYDLEAEQKQPFCTINQPKKFRVCLPLTPAELNQLREEIALPTEAALATIHNLRKETGPERTSVTVHYQNQKLGEVLKDLQSKTKDMHFEIDPDSGLSPDLPIIYEAHDEPLADALDHMFAKVGVGYIVVSDRNSAKNGWILVRPGRERVFPDGPRVLAQVPVSIRIQGRGSETWDGKVSYLPESEAKEIPLQLSNKAGGPVPVKAERSKSGGLIPQTQYFLVYIDIENADDAMAPGTMAQVKIKTKSETCLKWVWRTVNTSLELRLM
jgi:hypothetical protein